MTYPAVPDRRMPYDTDGTVVAYGGSIAGGILTYLTGTPLGQFNDYADHGIIGGDSNNQTVWFAFPGEQREVTAAWLAVGTTGSFAVQGSNDTTNGVDGTWETATHGTLMAANDQANVDGWRNHIFTISFTGPKAWVRFNIVDGSDNGAAFYHTIHIYGQKAAGQTPDDILFLDSDGSGAEFASPEDFGDRPLGTTVTRQFKVKNASATKTANSINIQCNDSDFIISTDGVTWVVTINIAALGAGVSSSVMYVRNTTPNPGGTLGPRHARVTAIVGSWT